MTDESQQIPQRERCIIKDCSNKWADLCRICALQICKDHILHVQDGGIPGGHWRCPICAGLSTEMALAVKHSPEAQHRREVFAGRMLLLLQEQISTEQWDWMMERAKLLGADTVRFRESIRTTIRDMGQYASEHDGETT